MLLRWDLAQKQLSGLLVFRGVKNLVLRKEQCINTCGGNVEDTNNSRTEVNSHSMKGASRPTI